MARSDFLGKRDGPGMAFLAAGLAALGLVVGWVATHEWRQTEGRFAAWVPHAINGDEPHYLVTLHSLLFDFDLDVRDDYAAVAAGGFEAGRKFRGATLDRHTIVVDPSTGRGVLWSALFHYDRRVPCEGANCVPFEPRTPHGFDDSSKWIETPAHPPAFPAFLAGALRPFSPAPDEVEGLAARALLAAALATLLVTAAIALRAGLGTGAALTAAALLALASPWLAYTKSFFSEGLASLPLVLGLWALVSGHAVLAGLAAVAALWIKPALVVVGAGWILERLLAGERTAALRLVCVMAAGGLALLAFNHFVLGRALVSGAGPLRLAHGLESLEGTLIDKRYGVLLFVPWIAVGLSGLGLRRAPPPAPGLYRQIAIPAALHLAVLSTYGFLGGTCYGPRYWIPFLPLFAVATAMAAHHGSWRLRGLTAVLALLTFLTVLPAALQYDRVWDERPYGGVLILLRGEP